MNKTFKRILETKANSIIIALHNQPSVTVSAKGEVTISEEDGTVTVTEAGVDFRDDQQQVYAKGTVVQSFLFADIRRITSATESRIVSNP